LPAQLVGGVLPEHGDDQVLSADVGGARLDGDAKCLVHDEPQGPDEVEQRRGGRLGMVVEGHQLGGERPGLLGGQAAGAQQRRAACVLVVPLPEDRGQQQVRGAWCWVPAVVCQRAGGAQGAARLLAESTAGHGASFGRQAWGFTALAPPG
jgi:hypothetical protein